MIFSASTLQTTVQCPTNQKGPTIIVLVGPFPGPNLSTKHHHCHNHHHQHRHHHRHHHHHHQHHHHHHHHHHLILPEIARGMTLSGAPCEPPSWPTPPTSRRAQLCHRHINMVIINIISITSITSTNTSPTQTQPPPVTPRQKVAKTHRPCQASFRSLALALKFLVHFVNWIDWMSYLLLQNRNPLESSGVYCDLLGNLLESESGEAVDPRRGRSPSWRTPRRRPSPSLPRSCSCASTAPRQISSFWICMKLFGNYSLMQFIVCIHCMYSLYVFMMYSILFMLVSSLVSLDDSWMFGNVHRALAGGKASEWIHSRHNSQSSLGIRRSPNMKSAQAGVRMICTTLPGWREDAQLQNYID